MVGRYFDKNTIEIENMKEINQLANMLEHPEVISQDDLKEIFS